MRKIMCSHRRRQSPPWRRWTRCWPSCWSTDSSTQQRTEFQLQLSFSPSGMLPRDSTFCGRLTLTSRARRLLNHQSVIQGGTLSSTRSISVVVVRSILGVMYRLHLRDGASDLVSGETQKPGTYVAWRLHPSYRYLMRVCVEYGSFWVLLEWHVVTWAAHEFLSVERPPC